MNGIGFLEIFLIAVIALIVVGPAKLPELAIKAGKTLNYAKRTINNVTQEVKRELDADALNQTVAIDPKLKASFEDIQSKALANKSDLELALLGKGDDVKRSESPSDQGEPQTTSASTPASPAPKSDQQA